MIIVGDQTIIPNLDETYDIYNFSGLAEGYEKLNLQPPFSYNNIETKSFDLRYAEYIFNNDIVFCSFFRIILSLYNGRNVFILTYRSDMLDILVESLLKIIQQRYGYNYQMACEYEDINRYDESSFSVPGLSALKIDYERYRNLMAKNY